MNDVPFTARRILGDAVKDLIELSGMSVTEVAELCHVARQTLYKIINGQTNVTIDLLDCIFRECGADFARWLNEQSLYGRDKKYHDQLQWILDKGGKDSMLAKTSLEAWIARGGRNRKRASKKSGPA